MSHSLPSVFRACTPQYKTEWTRRLFAMGRSVGSACKASTGSHFRQDVCLTRMLENFKRLQVPHGRLSASMLDTRTLVSEDACSSQETHDRLLCMHTCKVHALGPWGVRVTCHDLAMYVHTYLSLLFSSIICYVHVLV